MREGRVILPTRQADGAADIVRRDARGRVLRCDAMACFLTPPYAEYDEDAAIFARAP